MFDLSAPTVLDRAIEWVAPVYARRRLHARAAMSLYRTMAPGMGGHEAGRTDSPELRDWMPSATDADGDTLPDLSLIRARTRDMARNEPLAAGAQNTTVTGVVGSGIAAKPAPDRTALGLSDREADRWESRARLWWEAWAESTACDLEGELDFYALQDLTFRSVLESGDVLTLHRWRDDRGTPTGTRIQLVEADRISTPRGRPESSNLRAGVETDPDGRTVRWYVADHYPQDAVGLAPTSGNWTAVDPYWPDGTRRGWLLYFRRRIGQRRGVPYLAPIVRPMRTLGRYTQSELMAALASSLFTVFIRSERGDTMDSLDALAAGDIGPGPGGSERSLRLGHGLIAELEPGESIESFNPNRPNVAFDAFVTSIQRQMGVALELPFEVLTKHFASSYSASRAALLEAWRFFRHRREWMVANFCDPAYGAVIAEGVRTGFLEAPGFFRDPLIRRAWLGCQWAGDSMPQLDPLKEVKAAEARVAGEFSTREREAMELTGTDWEQNHRQREKEERYRRAAGLAAPVLEGDPLPTPDPETEVEA